MRRTISGSPGRFLEPTPEWLNPYSAYLGASVQDDGANANFLRNGLGPIIADHGYGAIIIHHTPKTNFRDTTEWKQSDWMYAGAGAAMSSCARRRSWVGGMIRSPKKSCWKSPMRTRGLADYRSRSGRRKDAPPILFIPLVNYDEFCPIQHDVISPLAQGRELLILLFGRIARG